MWPTHVVVVAWIQVLLADDVEGLRGDVVYWDSLFVVLIGVGDLDVVLGVVGCFEVYEYYSLL